MQLTSTELHVHSYAVGVADIAAREGSPHNVLHSSSTIDKNSKNFFGCASENGTLTVSDRSTTEEIIIARRCANHSIHGRFNVQPAESADHIINHHEQNYTY